MINSKTTEVVELVRSTINHVFNMTLWNFLWCMVSKPLYAAEAFLWKETDKNIHSNNMDEISEKSYQDKKKLPFKAWYIRQEST